MTYQHSLWFNLMFVGDKVLFEHWQMVQHRQQWGRQFPCFHSSFTKENCKQFPCFHSSFTKENEGYVGANSHASPPELLDFLRRTYPCNIGFEMGGNPRIFFRTAQTLSTCLSIKNALRQHTHLHYSKSNQNATCQYIACITE